MTVFNVPAGRAFLPALAEAILAGNLPRSGGRKPSPFDLSKMTVLLPTPRAARALAEAFLVASGGKAMLLPRIRPISFGLDDLQLLRSGVEGGAFDGGLEIPPEISEIERRLLLTRLVMQWSAALRSGGAAAMEQALPGASTPAQAALLANELAALMDVVETEGVSLDGLKALVPEDYSAHWEHTLNFLSIVVQTWPAILAATGQLSHVERRNQVIKAEAARLKAKPSADPIIVAGVTGSIPATVALMRVVTGLPLGAIVLPALDTTIDAESATSIRTLHPEHPQFGLLKLLAALNLSLGDVEPLPGSTLLPKQASRQRLIGEAMRPASTLQQWQDVVAQTPVADFVDACDGLSLIEAPTADHEAEVAALILRHAVDTPGCTAALVSPDRLLARRVVNRLETMGLAVDDSAGRPLAKTPPGAFLNLVIDAWADDFAPVALMALLRHPLLRLRKSVRDVRRAARALELAIFRRPYLGRGLEGVAKALDTASQALAEGQERQRAIRRLRMDDLAAARELIVALSDAYAPFFLVAVDDNGRAPLQAWAQAHHTAATALAEEEPDVPESAEGSGGAVTPPCQLWQEEAGDMAASFFTEVTDADRTEVLLAAGDYPDFYRGLTLSINVRPRHPVHPRISIWGPFESRLQQPDILILGGLNDGVWPAQADPGAWLNRPMRAELGMPSPEEKIGQAAHDFCALACASQVYLTRSAKADGVPTVPSRWLLRLTALLEGARSRTTKSAAEMLAPRAPWLAWAGLRDDADRSPSLKAPAPRPPLAWRPRRLPVTAIERWLANPYAIYAQHILKLDALDPIGREPGAAVRGQIIHDALHRFSARYPSALPDAIAARLLEEARLAMQSYSAHPRVAAFWLPRFERFAHWFAETEPLRRAGVQRTSAEVDGSMVLAAPSGPFTLKARADRIDVLDGTLTVVDYKTGRAPNDKRVNDGLSPQLPLEAAIALAGGFADIAAKPIRSLAYIRISGGEPPGEYHEIKTDDVAALIELTQKGLERLVATFDDPDTPYRAVRRAAYADAYDYDAYAHLARVSEWSADGGAEL